MYERHGRHDRRREQEDASRRHLRAGMAKVALQHRRVRLANDSYGHPLAHAVEMAERHSERTLEQWSDRNRTKTVVSVS